MIILEGDANNGRGEVRCGCVWFNGGSKKCVDFTLGRKSALCPSVHRLIRPYIRPSIGYMTACPTDYLMSVHQCVCLRALHPTQSFIQTHIHLLTHPQVLLFTYLRIDLSIDLPTYLPKASSVFLCLSV